MNIARSKNIMIPPIRKNPPIHPVNVPSHCGRIGSCGCVPTPGAEGDPNLCPMLAQFLAR
jgi:hypothetical protein